jgi:hypothetical protein
VHFPAFVPLAFRVANPGAGIPLEEAALEAQQSA